MSDRFKWRHYQAEIILTCVCWYLRHTPGYRDLENNMVEQGHHYQFILELFGLAA